MLKSDVFDIWANEYDNEVKLTDEKEEFPFAGYKIMMDTIYSTVMEKSPTTILDIGIGTGVLALRLYEGGNAITGVDFSNEMLSISKPKMPNAKFYQYNFAEGLPPEIKETKYDFIVSTYALHHLTDSLKVTLIKLLLNHLNENGLIMIGDISFQTRDKLEVCKKETNPDDWDDDEYFFVFSEISQELKDNCFVSYKQISYCGGIMEIKKRS